MRFAHISDLHLGKRLSGYSLYEDQREILSQIVELSAANNCDALLISGDIYDKSSPSSEAVGLFDEFLTKLSSTDMKIFIISGNHDSPERVGYGSRIMENKGIYIASVFDGEIKKVTVEDGFGEIDVYLCPFVKPSGVRSFYPEEKIDNYTDMMKVLIEQSVTDKSRRSVMLCHQFITGASVCESESVAVGTLDNIDAGVFESFDYVALGHIHSPQNITSKVRYCGTPLKYSVSEAGQTKSLTIAEIKQKGVTELTTVAFSPIRDLREIRGTYEELMSRSNYGTTNTLDYLHVTLTDENDIPNALQKLRTVYQNLIQLDYDNLRTRTISKVSAARGTDNRSPLELFSNLYKEQNGADMTLQQQEYVSSMIEKIWGDE